MIPELTLIRTALRNYEVLYENALNEALQIKTQFITLLQAYNILQNRYNDLETKYNTLLNDRQDTDTKKPQETIPEVLN